MKAKKRGKSLEKIGLVIDCLAEQKALPIRHNEATIQNTESAILNLIGY